MKELFSFFKVVFLDDVFGNELFVCDILEDDIIEFEFVIVLFFKGVVLKFDMYLLKYEWLKVVKVIVVEVNVVYDEDGD